MLDVRLVDLLETFHLDQSDDALKLAAEVGRQGPKLLGCILVDDNNTPVSHVLTSYMMLTAPNKPLKPSHSALPTPPHASGAGLRTPPAR